MNFRAPEERLMFLSARSSFRPSRLVVIGLLTLAPATAFAGPPGDPPSPYEIVTVNRGVTPEPGFGAWISGVAGGVGESVVTWATQVIAVVSGQTS
jgi:hypothetical protein